MDKLERILINEEINRLGIKIPEGLTKRQMIEELEKENVILPGVLKSLEEYYLLRKIEFHNMEKIKKYNE